MMSDEGAIRRDIGTTALVFLGFGSMVGSGWLFGAWRAAQIAGPDAIYAWIIGAAIMMIVALPFIEMGAMFPRSGSAARYGYYSHGSLLGFLSGWSAWVSIALVIPVEAIASVQYMSSWSFEWAHSLYVYAPDGQGELTPAGLVICGVLLIVYFLINFWSVKMFARTTTVITIFKVIVPALTAIVLIYEGFHPSNFSVGLHGGAHAHNFSAILTAVATSGVMLAFAGFQQPLNFAGEARNPGRSIPLAIFGTIILGGILYFMLQLAFLGGVDPAALKNGWVGLELGSPFAQLALMLNLNWLAILLYADAFVSPGGAGITYTGSTARMLYALERNGNLPRVFGELDPVYGVPRKAMTINLMISFVLLYFFRGWGTLASLTSVAIIVTYTVVPISVVVMRRTAVDAHRPLRIPALKLFAMAAFVISSLMLYWSRWPHPGQLMLLLMFPLPIYIYYEAKRGWVDFAQHFKSALWFIGYLLTIAGLSWAGSPNFGGHGYIAFGWDQLCVVLASSGCFWWGVQSGWHTPVLSELVPVDLIPPISEDLVPDL